MTRCEKNKSLFSFVDTFKVTSNIIIGFTDIYNSEKLNQFCRKNENWDHKTTALEFSFDDDRDTKFNIKKLVRLAKLLEEEGISAQVINIHTIKPLDEELIVAAAKKTKKVVTVEEHSIIGGLGGAVSELLSEKAPTQMLRIGVMDTFGESGPATELIKKYGLDAKSIYEKVKAFK